MAKGNPFAKKTTKSTPVSKKAAGSQMPGGKSMSKGCR